MSVAGAGVKDEVGVGPTTDPAPPASAFESATACWKRRGNRGVGRESRINKSPPLLADLAEYFGGLSVPALASCWVACIVDQCIGSGLSVGDMSRALVVVAERLHQVNFTTEATMIQNRTPTEPGKASAAPRTVGKYQLFGGDAPEAAGRKTKYAEAIAAVLAMGAAGGWFEWVDGPKAFSSPALSKKMTKASGVEVVVYRSTAGKVIVKRIAKA